MEKKLALQKRQRKEAEERAIKEAKKAEARKLEA